MNDFFSQFSELLQNPQKINERMQRAQKKLGEITSEGQSGGGMVTVVSNAKGEVLSMKLAPELFSEDEKFIVDLIISATNNSLDAARKEAQSKLGKSLMEFEV